MSVREKRKRGIDVRLLREERGEREEREREKERKEREREERFV